MKKVIIYDILSFVFELDCISIGLKLDVDFEFATAAEVGAPYSGIVLRSLSVWLLGNYVTLGIQIYLCQVVRGEWESILG